MSAFVATMGLRSRFQAWLEDILPYTDRATARIREERFSRQLAKSRKVQAEADEAIVESRSIRAHLRGSHQRADARLGRR